MKYFIPNYIEEHKMEDGTINIVNRLNGAEIIVDQNNMGAYYELKMHGTDKIDSAVKRILKHQDVLVDMVYQRKMFKRCLEVLNTSMHLVIMPTERCNFRCIYCYETHENKTMTPDNVWKIKNYIANLLKVKKINSIEISWFGGEPTLEMDIIKDVMTFVQKEKGRRALHSSITTNGYLLNVDNFKNLYNHGVTDFQITLDGRYHDKKRPLITGSGTIETIMNNLDEIKKLDETYAYTVILRNNILAKDNDFGWYLKLKEKFGDDDRFRFSVIPVVKYDSSMDFETEEDEELEQRHLEYMRKIGLTVEPRVSREALSCVCFAAYRYGYVFRADGSVGKCTVHLSDPQCCIGEFLGGELCIEKGREEKWIEKYENENCMTCKNLLMCMNRTCPYKKVKGGNDYLCIDI